MCTLKEEYLKFNNFNVSSIHVTRKILYILEHTVRKYSLLFPFFFFSKEIARCIGKYITENRFIVKFSI